MAKTERINLLVSPDEKAEIEAQAKQAHLTISELVRQALARHDVNVDFEELVEIAEELSAAVQRMSARLDSTLARAAALEQQAADRESLVASVRAEFTASGVRWPFQLSRSEAIKAQESR